MPLHDHFRPPLSLLRHWHSFHHSWATFIAIGLKPHLPPGYFAEPNVQFGIEIDVASFEAPGAPNPSNGGWMPPPPVATIPYAVSTDQVEVLIYEQSGGLNLVGAIELVSPRNKDRPTSRDAFVSKCLTYLNRGVGLLIVDVVTERHANLHAELMARLDGSGTTPEPQLAASGYRPVTRDGTPSVAVWVEELVVGRELPTMPLWLPGERCLPVELEGSYARTFQEFGVPLNGTS